MQYWRWPLMAEAGGDGGGSGGGEAGGATAVAEAPVTTESQGSQAAVPANGGPARNEKGQFTSPTPPPDLPPVHWASGLDAELQGLPRVKEAKTLTDYVQRNREMEAYIGRSIQLPQDWDATKAPDPEAMAGVWKKLGRPEAPTDYQLPESTTTGEAVGWDKELTERFRAKAHQAGLAQWQVDALIGFDAERWEYINNQIKAQQAAEKYERENVLAGKHGERLERVRGAARDVWEKFGNGVWNGEAGTRAWEKLAKVGLDSDPDVVESFANMYESMREANYLTNPQLPIGTPSVNDIDRQIQALAEEERQVGGFLRDSPKDKQLKALYDQKAELQRRSAA